jgi:hypothetical protein
MLTRPGSQPGPAWMRRFGDGTIDPRRLRKAILRVIVLFGMIQVTAIVIADIAVYRAHGRHVQSYNSPIQIAGMPLLSVGWRSIGGLAIGNAALGGLAIGRCAYAGNGVALGRDEASGNQKESLFG